MRITKRFMSPEVNPSGKKPELQHLEVTRTFTTYSLFHTKLRV